VWLVTINLIKETSMPLPLIAIAVPIVHSSGAWIAATGASGYLAGTLSGTWVGAFVLGNSTLLGSLGLVSAAGIFGAGSGVATLSSGALMGIGSGLTAIGLGGVANTLGIAPVVTFLGLTPVGWAVAAGSATIISSIGYYFTRKVMKQINEERKKGGLEPTTVLGIIKEVKDLETSSIKAILTKLSDETRSVALSENSKKFTVDGSTYPVERLRYFVKPDGSEVINYLTRVGRTKPIFIVKTAD
jgi:membrane protein implicated in regulation of membrane protease activity